MTDATIYSYGATRRTPATAGPPGGTEQELKARKKELQDAQRRQRDNLQKQIRRAQARISAAERKRRTRRLILMGSYLEHVTGNDPDKRDRLIKDSMYSWNGIGIENCSSWPQTRRFLMATQTEPATSAIFRALRSVDVDPDLAYEAPRKAAAKPGRTSSPPLEPRSDSQSAQAASKRVHYGSTRVSVLWKVDGSLLGAIQGAAIAAPADYVHQQGWVLTAFRNVLGSFPMRKTWRKPW